MSNKRHNISSEFLTSSGGKHHIQASKPNKRASVPAVPPLPLPLPVAFALALHKKD